MNDPTPNGVRVFARLPGGGEVEVTEGVKTLYDLVISSLDWGSGFITIEDALPVVHVAQVCGLAEWQEAQQYVDRLKAVDETNEWLRLNPAAKASTLNYRAPEHDHVFNRAGHCMWSYCYTRLDLAVGPTDA